MPGDGSFLAGGDHANLDRTRTRANKVNGPVICFPIEFDAQPAQSVADQRTHFSRVLADASGEHYAIQPLQRDSHCADRFSDFEREEVDRLGGAGVAAGQQHAHVAGDAGHSEQTRLVIQNLFELLRRQAALALQIKQDAGIDRPAARAHHHTVERREAHGGIDAPAIAHRAEACAAAEMRDNGSFTGERW